MRILFIFITFFTLVSSIYGQSQSSINERLMTAVKQKHIFQLDRDGFKFHQDHMAYCPDRIGLDVNTKRDQGHTDNFLLIDILGLSDKFRTQDPEYNYLVFYKKSKKSQKFDDFIHLNKPKLGPLFMGKYQIYNDVLRYVMMTDHYVSYEFDFTDEKIKIRYTNTQNCGSRFKRRQNCTCHYEFDEKLTNNRKDFIVSNLFPGTHGIRGCRVFCEQENFHTFRLPDENNRLPASLMD